MKMIAAAILMALAFNAGATNNNPPNECGNHGNNCQGGQGGNSSYDSSSNADAVGVGVGVGLGGNGGNGGAGGHGGSGGSGGVGYGGSAVGLGGSGGDSSSAVVGSGNSTAHGGDSKAYGGNASQGQEQGQGQSQSSVSGSKSIAQQALENSTRVDASSKNANQSSASGNTTATTVNVGGDSTLVERNAPPVFLGNLTATMSCAGGFNAGASDRNGSGAFGFTWISADCRSVVIGREFVGIGMADVGCRIWKTTKGYKRAVKADPSLANVDCTAKPAPAAVVVPVAPDLAPRIPRG